MNSSGVLNGVLLSSGVLLSLCYNLLNLRNSQKLITFVVFKCTSTYITWRLTSNESQVVC